MGVIDRIYRLAADCAGVLLARALPTKASGGDRTKRVTFVQFGDYAEAFWRFDRGGAENYYAQKYSVEFVGSLPTLPDIESVTVICVSADAKPSVLPNRIHTVGLELYPKNSRPRFRELLELVNCSAPTHLIPMMPCIPLITWGVRTGCRVLPILADSFRGKGLKAAIDNRFLGALFNAKAIEFIANHNLAASLELKRIGVPPEKIVPFDWPAVISPREFETKSPPPANAVFRLLYVGAVFESKGVGDAISAVALLRDRGTNVTLTIIGNGDLDAFRTLVKARSVQDSVNIVGPRSHSEVVAAMRDHDAVVVPSHWSYPEGLPMTLYEALCTRTPLLTSDHPMFALKIKDGYNSLVFPERNTEAFANRIRELREAPDLYTRLSANALTAAEEYLCPLKFDVLISNFIGKPVIDLRKFTLANA